MVGGPGGAVLAQSPEPEPATFPTGEFVQRGGPYTFDFGEDGSWSNSIGDSGGYVIEGDLYTEATHDWRSLSPATYRWDWDGWQLTFAVVEDDYHGRMRYYTQQPWVRAEDSREVLLAARDIAVGERVTVTWGRIPVAEANPSALTHDDVGSVVTSLATVPIEMGTPITPDLLEPAE
jgi:hypothetical protein